MSFHKDLGVDNIHQLNDQAYADITARDADSDFNTNADNLNKVVRVDSPLAYYILVATTPTFEPISNGVVAMSGFTMHFDANSALFPDSNPAAADSRNSHPVLNFDDTTAESVVFNNTIPNTYSGESINVDIDWVAETATTGGVTWGVEVEANTPGGNDIDSDSFDTQQTGNSDTNATSGIITRTTITLTQAEADAIAANDSFRLRMQRVVSDGDDDMTDDAQIVKLSLRV